MNEDQIAKLARKISGAGPDKETLLAEIEDVLRTVPSLETLMQDTPESLTWLGRASAAMALWNALKALAFQQASKQVISDFYAGTSLREMMILLHEAQNDLRMRTLGPVSVAIGQGMVFQYFDTLRKVIAGARQDAFFIDPYLDAEFASRYLPYVSSGVTIRLLTNKCLASLLPAVDEFAKENGVKVAVRSDSALHDRYVFIDKSACYQSGASFKDGAKNAGTTLTQITDAFAVMLQTYEDYWSSGKVKR